MADDQLSPIRVYLDRIDETVHEAYFGGAEAWRGKLIQVIREVENARKSLDAWMAEFCIGYAWFQMPGRLSEDYSKARECFLRSLLINEFPLTRYYIASLEFEYSNYEASREHLNKLRLSHSDLSGLGWKATKAEEISVCCDLRINYWTLDEGRFFFLCDKYANDRRQDWVLPQPIELLLTVDWLVSVPERVDSVSRKYASRILKLIDQLGAEREFDTLRKAIASALGNGENGSRHDP